jgi:hypothetical protein
MRRRDYVSPCSSIPSIPSIRSMPSIPSVSVRVRPCVSVCVRVCPVQVRAETTCRIQECPVLCYV